MLITDIYVKQSLLWTNKAAKMLTISVNGYFSCNLQASVIAINSAAFAGVRGVKSSALSTFISLTTV